MTGKGDFPDTSDIGAKLRRKAEKKAREKAARPSDEQMDPSAEESRRMLHELRIHQIELEMQNEELHRIQAELHASQARYFDLYDLAPVGYCTISEKGFILEANLTAATLLNVSRNLLAGQPISRYILKQDQDIYYLHHKRLIETGELQSCELRMVRADNPPAWVRLDGTVARDENGTPFCRMVMTDISRRKQAETELMELNETLEKRVEDRTRLIKDQAGQLRTLAVELIKAEEAERRKIADVLHNDLQQILASAKLHLQGVCPDFSSRPELKKVDDLLKESIEKSRSLSAELSPVIVYNSSLSAALKWLVSRMKAQFGLEVQLDTDEAYAIDDEAMRVFLFRAVQELLFNAAKHSDANSARVIISTSGQTVTIRVRDPGLGFDPETIGGSDVNKGIGLLSLRERAKAMGGFLVIESSPGEGSCFTVTVPFALGKGKSAKKAETTTHDFRRRRSDRKGFADGKNIRVLFVDDHKVTRQGLVSLIASQPGLEVAGEAANGQEAIDLVRKLKPDVVVTDVSMPVMNGEDATRRIRAEWPDVRVIGLSMFDDQYMMRAMFEAGAETCLHKTVSADELVSAIRGKQPP